MGDPDFMKEQIEAKLSEGFNCIKLKIGAIDFSKELSLLEVIRTQFSPDQIEIRVDQWRISPRRGLNQIKPTSQFSSTFHRTTNKGRST